MSERLDKLLSASGRYTRREARAAITAGRVTVDGQTIVRPETKVSRESIVLADGREVDTAEFVYYMLHKPEDYVSATEDERYPAVTRLFPKELQARGIFPVGRLDADVTGLLLMTDDGAYAHKVTSPRSGTEKRYEAWLDSPVGEEDADKMAAGIILSDGTEYRPAKLEPDPHEPCHAWVTVTEGKYHEVKNLFAVCGHRVLRLKRISIGKLILDADLPPCAFRRLSVQEIQLALE